MHTLLQDRLAPVTSRIGLLELSLEDAERAFVEWHSSQQKELRATEVTGQLPQLLGHLEPLTSAVRPRRLLVATQDPSWTAYFDCGLAGSDPESPVAHLSRTVRCHGLVVSAVPHTIGTGLESPGRHGAVQLYLLGPLKTEVMNYVRTLSVAHDGRWRFDANGTVQDYEETEQYQNRRVRDRFTSDMLVRYCSALGVEPFDEDFYGDRGVLLQSTAVAPDGALTMTLEAAQRHWGIVPGAASKVSG